MAESDKLAATLASLMGRLERAKRELSPGDTEDLRLELDRAGQWLSRALVKLIKNGRATEAAVMEIFNKEVEAG